MTDFRTVVAEVRELTGWRPRLFGAGCADRLAPVVRAMGAPATYRLYADGVDAALDGAGEHERTRLAARLTACPEMAAEHSGQRAYWPKLAVVTLTMVLRSGTAQDPGDIGRRACSLSLELHETVDGDLAGGAPRFIGLDHGHRPGPEEAAEIAVQRRTIEVLRDAPSVATGGRAVRDLSAPRKLAFASVLPRFIRLQ